MVDVSFAIGMTISWVVIPLCAAPCFKECYDDDEEAAPLLAPASVAAAA